jgi:hypothetical protein
MQLELSIEEADALKEVLDEKLVNLAREINRTDHLDLKQALKARERALDHIASSLSVLTADDATRVPRHHA